MLFYHKFVLQNYENYIKRKLVVIIFYKKIEFIKLVNNLQNVFFIKVHKKSGQKTA